jgi:glucose-6-phosphate 1-epimerase
METYCPTINALADYVTIIERDELKIVRVVHPKAEAEIALHGAHVLSFKPTGQQDVLWLSDKSEFNPAKAIRGGIPICWPWFGRVATPAHGFARISQWQLVEHRETEDGVLVCLGLEDNETTHAMWPHAFQARVYVDISDSLKVTLEITNRDKSPWNFSGALHSYFNIADIKDSITTGMGPEYADSLQAGKICQGDSQLQLTDTVDRVYTQPEAQIAISDPKHDRTITIENGGANSAVIWNPWQEGASNMADMSDNGYLTMLCVESTLHAPSLESGKTLQPGESYQLSTHISL